MNIEILSDLLDDEVYDPKEHFLTEEERDVIYEKLGDYGGRGNYDKRVDLSFIQTLSKVYQFRWRDIKLLPDNITPEYVISVWYQDLPYDQKTEIVDQISKDDRTIGKVKRSQQEVTKFLYNRGLYLSDDLSTECGVIYLDMCNSLLSKFGCELTIQFWRTRKSHLYK